MFKLSRACPNCGARVNLLQMLSPGFKGGNAKVVCKSCSMSISKSMRVYNFIGLVFGLPLGLLLDDIVEWVFGVDIYSSLFYTCLATGGLVFVFLIMIYYFLPLKLEH